MDFRTLRVRSVRCDAREEPMARPTTLTELFEAARSRFGEAPAIRTKTESGWEAVSLREGGPQPPGLIRGEVGPASTITSATLNRMRPSATPNRASAVRGMYW